MDLFWSSYVLLTGEDGHPWCEAATRIAERLRVPLRAYRVGPTGDLVDVDGDWAKRYGLPPGGAVLVRPDAFVAWRGTSDPLASETVLAGVVARAAGGRPAVVSGPAR